ncbi:hypothetical protein Tco_0710556 [Tanacetum coccineum]
MSTQQDIYAASSENRPPMLNKDNYVPWSFRLIRYAKSIPNEKLLMNLIKNRPYVRRMIHEPGDPNNIPLVAKSTHEQIDNELTEKEAKQTEAGDQAIQTILMGLLKDIYAAEKKAKLFNELEKFNSTEGGSIESYYHCFSKLMNYFSRNKHIPEKIASNLKSTISTYLHATTTTQQQLYPTTFIQHELLATTNIKSDEDISDPTTAINMALVLMAKAWNQNGYNVVQNVRNQVVQNTVHNSSIQNVENQNGLIVVPGIANQNANLNGKENVVAARAEGNGNGNNSNIDEIEEVNANCILMANLQQTSISGTQTDKASIYDSDRSTEVQQNDSNIISVNSSMEHSGGTVEQQPATVEETRAFFESLYNSLVIEVEKVNAVNRKMKETNADLTIELATYK